MLGTLLAYDLFVFYVFWEVMLVPMYLLIGIWGGERRIYAAVKFFLFTMAGSLLMLVAILWMAWTSRASTAASGASPTPTCCGSTCRSHQQIWLFAGLRAGLRHQGADVPGPHLAAGRPRRGADGRLGDPRRHPAEARHLRLPALRPAALPARQRRRPSRCWSALAVIGIIYGALVAWVQVDMKKLVAYSSVAHLGFVMLGLLAVDIVAWQGSLLQMVNHGLSTGALFLLVGMIYDRRHTKKFDEFGGLAKVMPVFAVLPGLRQPGLGGPARPQRLRGRVHDPDRQLPHPRLDPVAFATFGVVLAAVYLLKMIQLTIWGPITKDENKKLADLSGRELAALDPALHLDALDRRRARRVPATAAGKALEGVLADYRGRLAEPWCAAQPTLRRRPPATASLADHGGRPMNRSDWMLLLPEILLSAGGVLVLLLDAIAPSLRRAFTAISLVATLAAAWAVYYVTPLRAVTDPAGTFHGLLETSPLTAAFSFVILLATGLCLLASQGYLRRERILSGEYHALLLWCATGLLLMLRATELLTSSWRSSSSRSASTRWPPTTGGSRSRARRRSSTS